MNNENNRKEKKRLIVLLLTFLIIAVACIVPVLVNGFSNKEKEAVKLSELVEGNGEIEGQYVQFEFDVLPVLVSQGGQKDERQLYYIKDTESHAYIAEVSSETMSEIIDMLDVNTGKLNSVYTLNGIAHKVDDRVKGAAIANSFKVFKNEEVNRDNFSEYFGEIYIQDNSVSGRQVTVYKIMVLLGVFLLVMAFGYVVPGLIRLHKAESGIQNR